MGAGGLAFWSGAAQGGSGAMQDYLKELFQQRAAQQQQQAQLQQLLMMQNFQREMFQEKAKLEMGAEEREVGRSREKMEYDRSLKEEAAKQDRAGSISNVVREMDPNSSEAKVLMRELYKLWGIEVPDQTSSQKPNLIEDMAIKIRGSENPGYRRKIAEDERVGKARAKKAAGMVNDPDEFVRTVLGIKSETLEEVLGLTKGTLTFSDEFRGGTGKAEYVWRHITGLPPDQQMSAINQLLSLTEEGRRRSEEEARGMRSEGAQRAPVFFYK